MAEISPPPYRTRLGAPSLWIVAALVLLYLIPGGLVQQIQLPLGLLWSQIFLFIVPALVALRVAGYHPLRFVRADRWPRAQGLVLGTSAAAFLCASALMGLLQSLAPKQLVEATDITQVLEGQSGFWGGLLFFGVIVGAPLAEELVFRGCLLPMLAERLPVRAALLWQAAIFSLIHLDPVGFLPRFILGIAFGVLWLQTGSLWAGIFAHALNNGISTALFLWSDPTDGGDLGRSDQLMAAGLTLAGGAALSLFLWLLERRRSAPLPSEDPRTWATPLGPRGLRAPELRPWLTAALGSAGVALLGVVVAGSWAQRAAVVGALHDRAQALWHLLSR